MQLASAAHVVVFNFHFLKLHLIVYVHPHANKFYNPHLSNLVILTKRDVPFYQANSNIVEDNSMIVTDCSVGVVFPSSWLSPPSYWGDPNLDIGSSDGDDKSRVATR